MKPKGMQQNSGGGVTKGACRSFVPLRRVQGDDKFTPKGRVVLDSYFLEHLAGDADVAQVNSAGPLCQCKGKAEREGPLGLHGLALSTCRGV